MLYICSMKTIKIIMSDGTFICRSGKKICEKECINKNIRIFIVDKTELKITKSEIREVEIT